MTTPANIVKQIRKAYTEGASVAKTAETFGVSRATVYRHLGNLPRHNPLTGRRPLAPDVISDIRKRYTSRQRPTAIARELGISAATVFEHTKDLPRRRDRTRTPPETIAVICKRYTEGDHAKDIANDLGISIATVHKYAAEFRRPTP